MLLTQTASRVAVVYASNGTTPTPIRPALVKPVIDGKYTDTKELELTEAGKKWVAEGKPLPKDEWDYGDESPLDVISANTDPTRGSTSPEAYLRAKFAKDKFQICINIVSDESVRPKIDEMTFRFDTMNTGKYQPGTPGLYHLFLEYKTYSPDGLEIGDYGTQPPGNPFPAGTVKFKSGLGSSPRSSKNAKIIEAEFDLNLLTKYYKQIEFYYSIFAGYSRLRYIENIHFSDETLPIVSGIWWVTFSISGLPLDFLAPIYVDSLPGFEARGGEKKTVTIDSGKQHIVSVPESIPSGEGSRYFCFPNSYVVKSACEVNFVYKTQHYLKLVKGEGPPGKSALEGEGWYDKGSSVRIKVSPTESSEGFLTTRFAGWKIGSNMISTDPEPVIPIDSPKTLTATWSTSINLVPVTLYVVLPIAAIVVVVGLVYWKIRSGKRRFTSWQRAGRTIEVNHTLSIVRKSRVESLRHSIR